MDLGLGVLEERNGDGGSDEVESDSDGEEGEDRERKRKRKEKDVMGELMGKKENVTAGIEEVG